MEHIIIKEEVKFNVLQAEDGYVITNYNVDEPITNYFSATLMYFPKSVDYSKYYAITEEQNALYEDEKRKAEEEEMNNNEEN